VIAVLSVSKIVVSKVVSIEYLVAKTLVANSVAKETRGFQSRGFQAGFHGNQGYRGHGYRQRYGMAVPFRAGQDRISPPMPHEATRGHAQQGIASPPTGVIYQTARGPARWDGNQFVGL